MGAAEELNANYPALKMQDEPSSEMGLWKQGACHSTACDSRYYIRSCYQKQNDASSHRHHLLSLRRLIVRTI